jgi:hypothetical protein
MPFSTINNSYKQTMPHPPSGPGCLTIRFAIDNFIGTSEHAEKLKGHLEPINKRQELCDCGSH